MNKYKANKVIIKSPLYSGVTHTFLMTDNQLAIYNEVTDYGSKEITLKVFGELTRKGCLNKVWFEKKKNISIH